MTTERDILDVLQSHYRDNGVQTIHMPKMDNAKDIWAELCSSVYGRLPRNTLTEQEQQALTVPIDYYCSDNVIYNVMQRFQHNDSLELVNNKGKLLKRFARYCKEYANYKICDSDMGIIGDVLQYYVNKQSTFYYDFTDIIDWNDGEFGKDDSCWFPGGCYSESREVYTSNGGWGIRFYDVDHDGIGRTWILPRKGMLFCFNAYGVQRPTVSKVLKAIFAEHGIKLHYKVMDSLYNSYNSEIPYINTDESSNSSGAFVLYPDDMESSQVPERYDIRMPVELENHESCYHCGRDIDVEMDGYSNYGSEIYCDRCYGRLFSFCEKCQEDYPADEITYIESDDSEYTHLCDDCIKSEDLVKCFQCNDYHTQANMTVDHDGDSFCAKCAPSALTFCEACQAYYYGTQIESHDCVSGMDFSGLIECKDYNLHANISVDHRYIEYHTATVYKIDGLNGLVLFHVKQIKSNADYWNICHELSGLALKGEIPTFKQAKQDFMDIAALGLDWRSTAEAIASNSETMDKIRKVVYAQA